MNRHGLFLAFDAWHFLGLLLLLGVFFRVRRWFAGRSTGAV
jgi:hypothetical protein